MSKASAFPKAIEDDGIDHVGIAEDYAMRQVLCAFQREHEDVRISLARHKYRGGWFILMSSSTALGQLQSDLAKDTTHAQMATHLELLYGRLPHASKQAGHKIKKALERQIAEQDREDDWENW